jgi:hypothetical protein
MYKEEFEDTKGVIRICKCMTDITMAKRKRTNYDLQRKRTESQRSSNMNSTNNLYELRCVEGQTIPAPLMVTVVLVLL